MLKTVDMERLLVAIAIVTVCISGFFEFLDELDQQDSIKEFTVDVIAHSFVVAILFYIWRNRPQATRMANRDLSLELQRTNDDLIQWQTKSATLVKGLGIKIDEQLSEWKLSLAEKEVALLLIKGLSTRELATMRGVGEKTIRQQASKIYLKANLEGRAELAAFFLEDLLSPSPGS